ncbi:alpha/beta hydrolase [Oryzibacter oryziterrae]|uniref:alpha/beta hydrolase n=1 Tax=Oryzibacter oryziterrae TaxID=2766474 RepID=UPI001F3289A2|nr:alpha/beta hydrolase [Oryzibacter oryziterrae]
MPLNPEIARLIEQADALNLPSLDSLSVAEARAGARLRARPQGKPVASIEAVSIPGDRGSIGGRIYRPFGSGASQVVVYAHGGGFVICDLDTHDNICRNIAADAGVVVVSVDYRLAPEHPFPAASDDMVSAVRWAVRKSPSFGGNGGRVIVAGDSAGAHLAAVAALRLHECGDDLVSGQLLVYPVTDHYSSGHASYSEFAEGYGLTRSDMVWFWDHFLPDAAQAGNPWVSPLRADDLSGLPPACVLTSECDVLRDEGEAYAARLSDAGVPVHFQRFNGLHHGCLGLNGQVRCVAPMQDAIVSWLRAVAAL